MILLAGGLLLSGGPLPATAANITVDTTAQGSAAGCSLTEAITSANNDNAGGNGCANGSGADVILLPAGTYTLTVADNASGFNGVPLGLPLITSAIVIQGATSNPADTIIEGPGAGSFILTQVNNANSPLTLQNLTVRNFGAPAGKEGGAIQFYGPLTITNCVVSNNVAPAQAVSRGGALTSTGFAGGPLTVTDSVFSNNSVGGSNNGGAILINDGPLTVTNSVFLNNSAGNDGGAISIGGGNPRGIHTITDSAFIGNASSHKGGAINVAGPGANITNIVRSYFFGNTATGASNGGGAITHGVEVNVTDSIFDSNSGLPGNGAGGAILGSGNLTVTGSTFTRNSAPRGGALQSSGSNAAIATISNSTFSENSATVDGGAIMHDQAGTLNLNNVTITNNTAAQNGGGIRVGLSIVAFNVRNSIIAGNTDGLNDGPDCFNSGTITSQGHNLIGVNTNCPFTAATGDQIGTAASPIDSVLGDLQDNGGPLAGSTIGGQTPMAILTHALLIGSPALEVGDPGTPGSGGTTCAATDQRGNARPGGTTCDIGAFEDATGTGLIPDVDLSVTKTDSPDPVPVGDNLTYSISVLNGGAPNPAPGVALTDTLPPGMTFVSATPNNSPFGTCSESGGVVTCDLGTIGTAGSVVVDIVVTPTLGGAPANTASATTLGNDTDPTNNSATQFTTVLGLGADLAITKSDSPDPVNELTDLTYTLTLSNDGPDDATGVSVMDTLPAGVTFVSATPSQGSCAQTGGLVTCNLNTIANGSSATITIVVTAPRAPGQLSNTASVSANEADPDTSNNTATQDTVINPVADLAVSKSDSPDPVLLGSNLTYTLAVTNNGPRDGNVLDLVDTLPAGVTFVSATNPQGSCAHAAGVVTCSLGPIAVGATLSVNIVVTPASTGAITNTATVTGLLTDSNPANNTDSEATTVNPAADLSVSKTDSPDPVNGGNNLTYTVTVANAGPSTATGVTLTDTLPAGVTFVSASAGCSQAAGTVTCNLGSLNSGANVAVTIVVTAPMTTVTLTNTASVTATEADPNTGNNSATAGTQVQSGFTLTPTSSSATVARGGAASFDISVSRFPNPITFACIRGLPAGASCAFNPNPVTPGANPATVRLQILTRAPVFARILPLNNSGPVAPLHAVGLSFLLVGLTLLKSAPDKRRRSYMALGLLLVLAMLQLACANGQLPTNPGGTPRGTFDITLSATSTNFQAETVVRLVVQ